MKNYITLFLFTLSIFATSASQAQSVGENWHQWRGPENNGVSRTAKPPLKWGEKSNLGWKAEIKGMGTSSPVVWGNKVFVTTAINTGKVDSSKPKPEDQPERVFGIKHPNTSYEMVVLCFDRKSGKQLWREVATSLVPHEGHHKDASFASASPFCDGERVYFWFGSAGLFAYSLDGKKLWERKLGRAKVGASLGEGSSPVIHDGKLVLVRDHGGQSTIECLDAANGKTLWKKDRDEGNTWATPAIVERNGVTQVITTGTKAVRSYNLDNGEIIWWASGLTNNSAPCPIVEGDTVYCMTGYKGHALLAIPITGKGDVTKQIQWKADRGTPYVPSSILYDDQLYFTQSNQGILTSLTAKDGSEVIERTRVPDLGDIYASPVGADGRVYLVGRKGTTVVIEHGKAFKVLATNQLDDNFHASPALAGKQIFLRGMRFLYCLEDGGTADGSRVTASSTRPSKGETPSPAKPKTADGELRQLLDTIAKRAIPKDYEGAKHQSFVDKWFASAPPEKAGEVGRLWKEQQRLYPNMKNKGASFIKILDYVSTKGNKNAKGNSNTKKKGNPNIKRKVKAEIRHEPGKLSGKTGTISGQVANASGKPMSGVMVSAIDDELRQSVSVFSQPDGRFKISDLQEGTFKIRARLPGQRDHWIEKAKLGDDTVSVTMESATGAELEDQRPASDAFAQLKFDSPRDRLNFKMMCSYCHQIGTKGFRSPEKPVDWDTMIKRMNGFGGLYPHTKETIVERIIATYKDDAVDKWPEYIPPPAPKGMVSKAKITTWEMGKRFEGSFHDLEVGDDGLAYVVHIGRQYTATLNPKTGERFYYRLPKGSHGPHSIEPDNDGDMWLTLCVSGEMAKLDLKTKEYTIISSAKAPAERGSWPHTLRVDPKDSDGYIWYTDAGRNSVFRLHPKTFERKEYHLLDAGQVKAGGKGESRGITPYGLDYSPIDGTIWYSKLNGNRIGRIDPKTPDGDITEWNPPFRGPRRLHVAPDGNVWVPGFGSGVFGKFDPKTEKWTTYPLPDYINQIPYALNVAPDGMVWICGTGNDTLYRFNPETEYLVEFPLPYQVSYTREIEFDKEGNVWTSTSGPARHMENACGTLIRLELPDKVEESGGMKLTSIVLSPEEQGVLTEAERAKLTKKKVPVGKGKNIAKLIQGGKFDAAPFDAVKLAMAQSDPQARGSALSAAFGRLGGGVGGVEINAVVKRVNSLENSRDRDFAINGLAHGLVGLDPKGALKWANSISEDGFRKVVVENVTRRIKAQPPQSGKKPGSKPTSKSMEKKTGIHRLENARRSPFDAFVYVNRVPDKSREEESPRQFAGRIHGHLANQEGRVLLKLPPGMDRAAYDGFKTFLGSEGDPKVTNCIACHAPSSFGIADGGSLRDLKLPDKEMEQVLREKIKRAEKGEADYAGLKITESDLPKLIAFQKSLAAVKDEAFRDIILSAEVVDVTASGKAKSKAGEPKLVGRVHFEGEPPKRNPVSMDEASRKLHKSKPLDESILVSDSGGLENVFIYVKNVPAGKYPPPKEPVIVDQQGSIFIPRVQGLRAGQTLLMKNGDPFIHNVRSLSRTNRPFNIAQPPGSAGRERVFEKSEGPISIKCDFHRWMTAHFWVMDHPFFAVTDAEGKFEIPGLPAGEYTLVAWHEVLGEREMSVVLNRNTPGGPEFRFRAKD